MAMGQRGQQSDRMLRAAESGNEAAQRAHDSKENRAESRRQFDESINQRELDRSAAIWERQRQDRLARDAQRAQIQAGKRRTTNFGGTESAPEDPAVALRREQLDLQRQELAQQGSQFQQSLGLEAAKAGLQPGGGQGADQREQAGVAQALAQNPDDPRLQRLQREMEQGRQQMGLGVESAGGRRWVPTPEAMQAGSETRETARINAEAARANAVNRLREIQSKASVLQAKIGASTGAQREQFTADMKKLSDEVVKGSKELWGLAPMIDTLKAIDKGKGTEEQWRRVAQELASYKGANADSINAEVAQRNPGPAFRRWMNEGINTKIIEHMARVAGHFPEGFTDNWDPSTSTATAFKANADSVSKFLKAGMAAQLYPITDQSDWARMIRQNAAISTMQGLAQPTGQSMGQAPAPGGEVVGGPREGQRGADVSQGQYDWSRERETHAGRALEGGDFGFKVPR